MKKILLLFLVILPFTSFAQNNCSAALTIAGNGTITTPSYASGSTFVTGCLASTASIRTIWYKYTPASNGEITVSSNLPINNGTTYTDDTRVSIFKGTCAASMTCVDSNDDIDDVNYLSQVTFPVSAGVTYYIQWDNYWYATDTGNRAEPLQFTFNFSPVSCIRVGKNDFYLPDSYTTTSANIYWNQAIGSPSNYDTDWSTNFATAAGSGTIITSPAGALAYSTSTLTSIPSSANFRYFVRSNCGGSQSAWQGPYYGYLAKILPYSNTFELSSNNHTDGFIGFTLINSTASSSPANYADGGAGYAMYTFNSTTAASDRWGYSRAISLQAGEEVTINFKTRLYAAAAVSPMSLDLTVGNAQTSASQTTVLQNFTLTDNTGYTSHTATWTAPSTGIYYFGFHNNSVAGTTQTFAFFDTLDITSVLSRNEFDESKILIYPNPVDKFVTISNLESIEFKQINLSDVNGRLIRDFNTNGLSTLEINLSDLNSGIYFLNIITEKGNTTKKLIKY